MEQNKWFRVFGQCEKCGKKLKTKTMIYCQECKVIKYCSNTCMGSDKDFHNSVCGNVTTVTEVTKYDGEFYTHASNESKTHKTLERRIEISTGLHDGTAKKLSEEDIAERDTTEEAIAERDTTEEAIAERDTTEEAIAERDTTEEAIAERDTTEEAIAERDTTEEAIAERDTTKTSICSFCKFISSSLLVCSKCSNVKYCNKECQQQDFKRHKLLCFSSLKVEIKNGSNMFIKRQIETAIKEEGAIVCGHCHNVKPISTMTACLSCCMIYCNQDCRRKNFLNHVNFCEILSVFHTVDDFITDRVPPEKLQKYGFPDLRFPKMFLLQVLDEAHRSLDPVALLQIIGWYHPQLSSPAVVVRDGLKNETRIIFDDAKIMGNITIKRKDRSAEMKMSPLDECLKPGNFILLTKVLWHHCKDGTQGLIVGDLDTVHFIHLE